MMMMCQIKSYIFFPLATVLKYSYAGSCMCSDRTKKATVVEEVLQ